MTEAAERTAWGLAVAVSIAVGVMAVTAATNRASADPSFLSLELNKLAPLRAKKRMVKLFDLEGIACERVGNFLLNDVIDCQADSGPVGDCLARIEVSALGGIQLSK